MATRYDQLAKQMLRTNLESRGSFTSELEVNPEPQYADGYFVPNLERASPLAGTLLGRMTEHPCSFEVFSAAPDPLEVEACLRKHLNLRHILRKTPGEAELPYQWILSAGKPSSALDATWARPATNWPSGVYELPPMHATSIIVLSELPEDRMNTQETFEMFVQRVELNGEQRGELEGKLEGQRDIVLRLLRRKFGALPEDVVTRVQTADAPLLEQLGDNVLFASSLEEVFGS